LRKIAEGNARMLATEISTDLHSSPTLQAEPLEAGSSVTTVKVYTRHNRGCAKRDRPDWARCNCVKWLYVYRNGKNTLTSARTRSWEKAEQKAREIRDAFDPIRQLQRRLEAPTVMDSMQWPRHEGDGTGIQIGGLAPAREWRLWIVDTGPWRVCS
jgi:hypothetical protein